MAHYGSTGPNRYSRAVIALATKADPCPARFVATIKAAKPYPPQRPGNGHANNNTCWYVERKRFLEGWKPRPGSYAKPDPRQGALFL